MSTPSTPTSPHECPSCHRPISPQRCNSNGNGNRGRIFISCYHRLNTGVYCKYFKWLSDPLPADSSSRSTSHSTSRSTSPTSLSSGDGAPPATLTIHLPARTSAGSSSQSICTHTTCKSTRIHPDCARKMCRRHCVANGRNSGWPCRRKRMLRALTASVNRSFCKPVCGTVSNVERLLQSSKRARITNASHTCSSDTVKLKGQSTSRGVKSVFAKEALYKRAQFVADVLQPIIE